MTESSRKAALVTGGAHRIGKSLCLALAREGWAVAIHYGSSADSAEALAREITQRGGKAASVSADLSSEDETLAAFDKAQQTIGPLSLIVNNASIFEKENWDDVTAESWTRHLNINLRAPYILSQALARELPVPQTGNIINIIDQRVWNLTPHFVSYTVSKAGLWTLTQTLALALAPRIRVNGIGPGPTLPNPRQDADAFKRQAEATPLERAVNPDEIAAAMCYLLSAPGVTGQMIAVDSGEHLGWAQPKQGQTFDG
jgi:NAD(P)-dependent dehydrogenase (short-subunit alcohol dehydrogenase family)